MIKYITSEVVNIFEGYIGEMEYTDEFIYYNVLEIINKFNEYALIINEGYDKIEGIEINDLILEQFDSISLDDNKNFKFQSLIKTIIDMYIINNYDIEYIKSKIKFKEILDIIDIVMGASYLEFNINKDGYYIGKSLNRYKLNDFIL